MGLRLSPHETRITHIEDGLDFLDWRVQRHRKASTTGHNGYIYPAKKAVHAIKRKIKILVPTGCCEPVVGRPVASAELDAARGLCAYF